MHENFYWSIKTVIGGYENVMIVYGEESQVKKYLEMDLKIPFTMNAILPKLGEHLFELGFKIYHIPTIKTDKENLK